LKNYVFQGLNLLIPVLDRIKYVQVLKEQAIKIPEQSAVTKGVFFVLFLCYHMPVIPVSEFFACQAQFSHLKLFNPFCPSKGHKIIAQGVELQKNCPNCCN